MAETQANSYPTAGIMTDKMMTMFDFFKPQYLPELMARFGQQFMPDFQMFRAMGRESPVERDEWFAFEENWYHRTILTTGSVGDPGAGNPITITLDSTFHDSQGGSYGRINEIVTIPVTNIQAMIIAKNTSSPTAHTFTLKPLRAADNIDAITGGTTLSITNAAFGPGTGGTSPVHMGSTKRTFYAQIFKEAAGTEGSQLVNSLWYSRTSNNKSVKYWYTEGTGAAEYRMALKMDGAFMMGVPTDNITVGGSASDPGYGNAIKTTKGLFPWVSELGKTLNYTAASWDPADMDAVHLYLLSQGLTSNKAMFMVGAKLNQDIENGMVDYLKTNAGGTSYIKIMKEVFKGNSELAMSINFKAFTKGGITFMLTPKPSWSNPQTFGATGYNMPTYGLITPLSRVKDAKSGKMLDNIATRYRAKGDYSRRFEMWDLNGAGNGLKVTDIDRTNTQLRSHLGLQALAVNQMLIVKPS